MNPPPHGKFLPRISLWRRLADSIIVKLVERFGVALLLITVAFILATGRNMVNQVWDSKIEKIMQPRLEASDRRVDTLAREIRDVKGELSDIRGSQREFFGAQMDLDPRFRRAVQARVTRNRTLEKKQREDDSALNGLLHPEPGPGK